MKTLVKNQLLMGYEYFSFAEICSDAYKKNQITHRENLILSVITNLHLSGNKVAVHNILHLKDIASQATIHGALKSLIKRKFLKVLPDPKDGRIKYLVPTSMSLKMYQDISKNIKKLIK